MTTIYGDKITAKDLSEVVIINSQVKLPKTSHLTEDDMMFQESRKARKVRKLDFEIR
jgi:hypothetical protein